MKFSNKEESILILLKELSEVHENIIKMYFGLGEFSKMKVEKIGEAYNLDLEETIKVKNDGIREFIKLILTTGIIPNANQNFSNEFIDSANSDLLDKFMKKFIG